MTLRVAVIADFVEEGWPSMDLVANMLVERLTAEHPGSIDARLIRPSIRRRASRLPGAGKSIGALFTIDRFANRLWDYPRALREVAERFDLFHIVDHSYSQLVHRLPGARTLVTCHDLDTFRSVLEPDLEPRSAPFRAMTRHILSGLQKAGHIACDTAATRDALVARVGIPAARTTVVPNGSHPSCTPRPEPVADLEAARLVGPASGALDLLHVGSTIARKRIDVLLRVVAAVRAVHPEVRLVRVGGPFTAEQRGLARDLGLEPAVVVLPFVDRSTLAAIYRRSALVLMPSDREGFGLPVLEALACGTPVVASDIDALREVGGTAALYCPPDIEAWTRAVLQALDERRNRPQHWRERQLAAIERASVFSWSRYAADVVELYQRLGSGTVPASAFRVAGPRSGTPASGSGTSPRSVCR